MRITDGQLIAVREDDEARFKGAATEIETNLLHQFQAGTQSLCQLRQLILRQEWDRAEDCVANASRIVGQLEAKDWNTCFQHTKDIGQTLQMVWTLLSKRAHTQADTAVELMRAEIALSMQVNVLSTIQKH